MKYIEPSDRTQYRMINCLDEQISTENPVRLIDSLIELIVSKNRNQFYPERPSETGRPAYLPTTMLKLYVYGYFNGISSSRKLEAETHRNIELRWLLGELTPDHWTISNYRKDNGERIKLFTKEFRRFLKESGYIKLDSVALDGSKVKAYTNREMFSREKIEAKLESLENKIEEYLERIGENDKRDEILEQMGDESNKEINKYLDKIAELKKTVEKLERQKEILEKEDRNYIGQSDYDANLMKSRDGKIPAYNVQLVVDSENKMIADSEVVTDEEDKAMLPVMLESVKEELGKAPNQIIVDAGYNNPDKIEQLEKKGETEIYASFQSTGRSKEEIKFTYDAKKDEYICSAGKRLVLYQRNKKKGNSFGNIYRGIECKGCPLREKCTTSKYGRQYCRYLNQEWRDDFRKRMDSKSSREKLRKRKSIAEHPFGTIKYLMGKIPLLLRGKEKVTTEINLYTTGYNLKRLLNLDSFDFLSSLISNYQLEEA